MHVELVVDMAARLAPGDAVIGFAALTHDLGKALTPSHKLPRHVGHEHAGLAPLEALCARLKVPAAYREPAVTACREHLNVHRIGELRDATLHDLIARCDGFRKPERIDQLATVCECDKRGRLGSAEAVYPQAELLRRAHAAARNVNARDITAGGLSGPAVGEALRKARIRAIAAVRNPD